jgi:hypothetical protein
LLYEIRHTSSLTARTRYSCKRKRKKKEGKKTPDLPLITPAARARHGEYKSCKQFYPTTGDIIAVSVVAD